jgi:cytochrome bd-type quinol oxidase subunit 2
MESLRPSELQPNADALDVVLRLLRIVGLIGFLGGLAALSAMWAFTPTPQSLEQWHTKIAEVKAIFFACSFTGIIILVVVGSISWWRHRRRLKQQRWFRTMIGMLVIAVPGSHIWARSTAERLYEAVEAGRMDQAADLWQQLGMAYVLSLTIMLVIASIGIIRPRMGQ